MLENSSVQLFYIIFLQYRKFAYGKYFRIFPEDKFAKTPDFLMCPLPHVLFNHSSFLYIIDLSYFSPTQTGFSS